MGATGHIPSWRGWFHTRSASWVHRNEYCVVDSDSRDIELLACLAEGRIAALGELARRHQANALALAHRILGQSDQAEDVVQEAFLRVHRAAKRFQPKGKFSTWLYQIVVNLCRDRLRRNRHAPGRLDDHSLPDHHDGALGRLEAEELGDRVRRSVHALPERQKLAVILHRFQRLSHEEVSEVTGWSVSAVESLLVRAYQQLREDLADLRE